MLPTNINYTLLSSDKNVKYNSTVNIEAREGSDYKL